MDEATCCWPECPEPPTQWLPDVPLCLPHIVRVGTAFRARVDAEDEAERAASARPDLRKAPPSTGGVIYYLRVGDLIKIGHSIRFGARMTAYPPDAELLAHQPGTREQERAIHASLAPHRAHRMEWYHPAPEVMAQVERVRAQNARESAAAPTARSIAHRKYQARMASSGRA